jgi:hypothetical protein
MLGKTSFFFWTEKLRNTKHINLRESDFFLDSSYQSIFNINVRVLRSCTSFLFVVLGIKPRDFCMLGKCATTEL